MPVLPLANAERDSGSAFGPEHGEAWARARLRLRGAGYGEVLCLAFERAAPICARSVGAEPALALAGAASTVSTRVGTAIAARLCEAAPAAARLSDGAAFEAWLNLIRQLARDAPGSVAPMIMLTPRLLARTDKDQLRIWAEAGVAHAGADTVAQGEWFSLRSPDAVRMLDHVTGAVPFADDMRRMRAYATALHGIVPIMQETSPRDCPPAMRRISYGDGTIYILSQSDGDESGQARDRLRRAGIAHVGAHLRFSGTRWEIGTLKPLQVALVSLVEDARVEALSIRSLPGLRATWAPYHVIGPNTAATAPNLMARLARALFDASFDDPNAWVNKGAMLFTMADPEDPGISRRIGMLLGNDLGQMRVQFNARNHVVQPVYRDDNLGLWHFPQDRNASAEVQMTEAMRPRPPKESETAQVMPPNRAASLPAERTANESDLGVTVARYPEYDYTARLDRPDWTVIREYAPRHASAAEGVALRSRHQADIDRITAVIRAARVGRFRRRRGRSEGDSLDIDAAVAAASDLRGGHMPDSGLYFDRVPGPRELAVSVLLDVSASTADPVGTSGLTVIGLLRGAAMALGHAMNALGDPFALTSFCSAGRADVRVTPIKPFSASFDRAAEAAIAGLVPGHSTRIGAGLRHAGAMLAGQAAHRRLVLIVTDGEPSDIDCTDPRYLAEDARHAVRQLAARGIDTFCVGLGPGYDESRRLVFGRSGFVEIRSIESLPEKLPQLYLRLISAGGR